MIVGINKKRVSFFLFLIAVAVVVAAGYKPIMKKYFYPKKFSEIVEQNAEKFGVDANLIYSIIKAESGFDKNAVSTAGAKGLMQITGNTASWIKKQISLEGDIDLFDPDTNIMLGTWYISKLISDNDGNLITALASYNAGGANVKKWQKEAGTPNILPDDMPFEETRNYVNRTIEFYEKYKKLWKDE